MSQFKHLNKFKKAAELCFFGYFTIFTNELNCESTLHARLFVILMRKVYCSQNYKLTYSEIISNFSEHVWFFILSARLWLFITHFVETLTSCWGYQAHQFSVTSQQMLQPSLWTEQLSCGWHQRDLTSASPSHRCSCSVFHFYL